MNNWHTTLLCFQMAKNAWSRERKKHLLTEDEIDKIDRTFFVMGELIYSYDHSIEQFDRFLRKLEYLRCLIKDAERKMGYVPIRVIF